MFIVKSVRLVGFYRECMRGLPLTSLSSHRWAYHQTRLYKHNLIQPKPQKDVKWKVFPSPQQVEIKRVDRHADQQSQKHLQLVKRIMRTFYGLKMWSLRFYSSLTVEGIGRGVSSFLKLYHESLSALVQGYREVTMDHSGKFRFEDTGESVQDRLDKFEDKLHRATTGQSKQQK